MAANSVDFEELYNKFKDMVFLKYGKKLSDKDPLVLQFLMQELFTQELSKRLAEFFAMSTEKLTSLAELWDKREDESLKKIDSQVKATCDKVDLLIKGEFSNAISECFKKVQTSLHDEFEKKIKDLIHNIKIISGLALAGTATCFLVLGFVLGHLIH